MPNFYLKNGFKKYLPATLSLAVFIITAFGLVIGLNFYQNFQENEKVADAFNNTYFVAKNGNDTNPGTEALPFLTIQKCTQIAIAGDGCIIKEGIYRETVTPTNSGTSGNPITFTNYQEDEVVVSGLDEQSLSWSEYAVNGSQKIYQASLGGSWQSQNDLNSSSDDKKYGKNQVFVEGQEMHEARWPNLADNQNPSFFTKTDWVVADGGSGSKPSVADRTLTTGYLTDSDLSGFSNNFLNDAKITVLPIDNWTPMGGTVTSSTNNQVNFNYYNFGFGNNTYYKLQDTSQYYLWGSLNLLDAPGEWFIDEDTKQIYLWAMDGQTPNSIIETKARRYAFDLDQNGLSGINLDGLKIQSASIKTNDNSSYHLFNNLTLDNSENSLATFEPWAGNDKLAAILLRGNNHKVINSKIRNTAGSGIQTIGSGHLIENNLLYNTVYTGTNGMAIGLQSDNNQVLHNYIKRVGSNAGIDIREISNTEIKYNDVSEAGVITSDGGAIMITKNTDGGNDSVLIEGNRIHNLLGEDDEALRFGTAGIYFEYNIKNVDVIGNTVYNTTGDAITLNYNDDVEIYHNILDDKISILGGNGSGDSPQIKNNFIKKLAFSYTLGPVVENNLFETGETFLEQNTTFNYYDLDPHFKDRAGGDYRLKDFSVLKGNAENIAGINRNNIGAVENLPASSGLKVLETDLASLGFDCQINNQQKVDCDLSNFPQYTGLSNEFQIKLGNDTFQNSCFSTIQNDGSTTAFCPGLNLTDLSQNHTVEASLDGINWINLGTTSFANLPQISSINPVNLPISSGSSITLSGVNFEGSADPIFSQTFNFTNNTSEQVPDYVFGLKLDTASLISAGKMQADCDDLRFFDSDGNSLPYWIENGCNTSETSIWLKDFSMEAGQNQYSLQYGDDSLASESDGYAVFPFFDDFSGSGFDDVRWREISNKASIFEETYRLNGDFVGYGVGEGVEVGWFYRNGMLTEDFQVEGKVKMVSHTPNVGSLLTLGSYSNTIQVFGNEANRKLAYYWDTGINKWQPQPEIDSSLDGNFDWQKVGFSYTGDLNSRDVSYYENDVLVDTRTGLNNPTFGFFGFGANSTQTRSVDMRFDDIRFRNTLPGMTDLVTSFGTVEVVNLPVVTVDGQACINLIYISDTEITCQTTVEIIDGNEIQLTNLTGGIALFSAQNQTPKNLIFSEINWAGSSASASDQWIELYNYGTETVDLTDLIIENLGNTTNPNLAINSTNCGGKTNFNLNAGEVFLISKYDSNNSQTLLNSEPGCVFADLELNTAGETLILKDGGEVVEEMS